MKAIDYIIGENKDPCDTDAAVFGMLSQIIFHDRGPLNEFAIGIKRKNLFIWN